MCVICVIVSDSLEPHETIAFQSPLSIRFSRQDYWSGLPLLFLGDLPNLGIGPSSPALYADSLSSEPPRKPNYSCLTTNTAYFLWISKKKKKETMGFSKQTKILSENSSNKH